MLQPPSVEIINSLRPTGPKDYSARVFQVAYFPTGGKEIIKKCTSEDLSADLRSMHSEPPYFEENTDLDTFSNSHDWYVRTIVTLFSDMSKQMTYFNQGVQSDDFWNRLIQVTESEDVLPLIKIYRKYFDFLERYSWDQFFEYYQLIQSCTSEIQALIIQLSLKLFFEHLQNRPLTDATPVSDVSMVPWKHEASQLTLKKAGIVLNYAQELFDQHSQRGAIKEFSPGPRASQEQMDEIALHISNLISAEATVPLTALEVCPHTLPRLIQKLLNEDLQLYNLQFNEENPREFRKKNLNPLSAQWRQTDSLFDSNLDAPELLKKMLSEASERFISSTADPGTSLTRLDEAVRNYDFMVRKALAQYEMSLVLTKLEAGHHTHMHNWFKFKSASAYLFSPVSEKNAHTIIRWLRDTLKTYEHEGLLFQIHYTLCYVENSQREIVYHYVQKKIKEYGEKRLLTNLEVRGLKRLVEMMKGTRVERVFTQWRAMILPKHQRFPISLLMVLRDMFEESSEIFIIKKFASSSTNNNSSSYAHSLSFNPEEIVFTQFLSDPTLHRLRNIPRITRRKHLRLGMKTSALFSGKSLSSH